MKIDFHHKTALMWACGAPWVFAPVVENAKRPDVGIVMAWGIAIVTMMILAGPLLLRWQAFRRWYGWTDALSDQQREALKQRNLRRYYQLAFDDGYCSRVVPYAWKITTTFAVLVVVEAALPNDTGVPLLDALIVFSTWYPTGVVLVMLASFPLRRIVNARCRNRS